MKPLENRWALVTGSSRGIGRQIALGLGRLGCNVIVHGRTLDNTSSTQQDLATLGVAVKAVAGDLAEPKGIDTLIDAVERLDVPVDILYNNAAINNEPTPMFEFSLDEWRKTFQVNLFAMVALTNALAPSMRSRRWGRIINLTSGIADQPQLAPYSASKAAVDKFTKDLACELKDDGVLVSHIDPGWIRTDLGGPNAWEGVESVLPGMLMPVLAADDSATGRFYAAQDFKGFSGW